MQGETTLISDKLSEPPIFPAFVAEALQAKE